jgi:hypothetical protein
MARSVLGPGARVVQSGSGNDGWPRPEEKTLNRTIQIAPVRKSLIVEASPEQAFETFTFGIDRWWPKSHAIGASPMRASVIEPFVGGRWYSTCEDGSEVTVGHVQVWEAGRRLVFSWEINARWQSDARPDFTSQVQTGFLSASGTGTLAG